MANQGSMKVADLIYFALEVQFVAANNCFKSTAPITVRLDARTLARLRLVDRGRRRSVALHRGDLGSLNTLTLWFENTASLVFQVLDDLMVPSAREGAELVP